MKGFLLKFLMVMALSAVICLPGVATANIILNFDDVAKKDLNNTYPYNLFEWQDWKIRSGAAFGFSGATITLIGSGTFDFDGADFKANSTPDKGKTSQ